MTFLLKYINGDYHLIFPHRNPHEPYDSNIKSGDYFFNDDLNDVIRAEYSPSSKISRKVIASTNKELGIPLIDKKELFGLIGGELSFTEEDILNIFHTEKTPDNEIKVKDLISKKLSRSWVVSIDGKIKSWKEMEKLVLNSKNFNYDLSKLFESTIRNGYVKINLIDEITDESVFK